MHHFSSQSISAPSFSVQHQMTSVRSKDHLMRYTSISGPGFLGTSSAINILMNPDISSKTQRFICSFHPASAYLIKGLKQTTSDEDIGHQPLWKLTVPHHPLAHLVTRMEASTSTSNMTYHQASRRIWSSFSIASIVARPSAAAWSSDNNQPSILTSQ